MNRDIKNEGEYFECDADELTLKIKEAKECDVLVFNKLKVELAGEDKKIFIKKFETIFRKIEEAGEEFNDFDPNQISDMVFREILL